MCMYIVHKCLSYKFKWCGNTWRIVVDTIPMDYDALFIFFARLLILNSNIFTHTGK